MVAIRVQFPSLLNLKYKVHVQVLWERFRRNKSHPFLYRWLWRLKDRFGFGFGIDFISSNNSLPFLLRHTQFTNINHAPKNLALWMDGEKPASTDVLHQTLPCSLIKILIYLKRDQLHDVYVRLFYMMALSLNYPTSLSCMNESFFDNPYEWSIWERLRNITMYKSFILNISPITI